VLGCGSPFYGSPQKALFNYFLLLPGATVIVFFLLLIHTTQPVSGIRGLFFFFFSSLHVRGLGGVVIFLFRCFWKKVGVFLFSNGPPRCYLKMSGYTLPPPFAISSFFYTTDAGLLFPLFLVLCGRLFFFHVYDLCEVFLMGPQPPFPFSLTVRLSTFPNETLFFPPTSHLHDTKTLLLIVKRFVFFPRKFFFLRTQELLSVEEVG